jgi:hypothetical protein
MKVPLKIRIFMWFVYQKEILTKDNLKKGIGKGAQDVVSMIMRRPCNIFSLTVLLLKLSGQLFTWLLILIHQTASIIFLELG